ncbi:MAG: protein translocase subunit SecD, partial [Rhodothermales bacterium]|nr:protein translocase subunit SecD [Rhodothermales bacterium]
MQGNGFKILVTLALLGLSFWYLFPTYQNYRTQSRLAAYDEEAREEFVEANYDDIQSLQERALKLGLDLQGGMHVALEVRMDALLRALAENPDETFEQALAVARERTAETGGEFVDTFVDAITEIDPGVRLSRYFRSAGADITRRSDNGEVADFLRAEADEAVQRAISIVRERVDRYGVSEPSIQRQGSRRIVVELPGVDDPQRVRNLLRGTARLEFRLMADPQELAAARNQVILYYEQLGDEEAAPAETPADAADPSDPAEADTTEAAPALAEGEAVDTTDAADAAADAAVEDLLGLEDAEEDPGTGNPLLDVLDPRFGETVIFGAVVERDTARVNELLGRPAVQDLLPPNIELMYTAKAEGETERGEEVYYLLGVRGGEAELTGEVITEARPDFDPYTNEPEVSITMNTEGAQTWSRLTGANVGKPVAIVLDNLVYSYPTIIDKIPSGRTSITGVTRAEAEDVVTVLKSGALPAPVDIVEERTVGPSLGAASIRAGALSVMVGLILVAIFMVLYYRTAGLVANL